MQRLLLLLLPYEHDICFPRLNSHFKKMKNKLYHHTNYCWLMIKKHWKQKPQQTKTIYIFIEQGCPTRNASGECGRHRHKFESNSIIVVCVRAIVALDGPVCVLAMANRLAIPVIDGLNCIAELWIHIILNIIMILSLCDHVLFKTHGKWMSWLDVWFSIIFA